MRKTNGKLIFMSLLWTLVLITTVVSSVAMTQSAKVATLRLEQTWTYDAPEYVSITAYANNGTFGSSDTYETCIRFSNIFTGTNLIPEPSRVGYTLNGWKYKVTAEGNIWSSYSNVSDHIPFTDHLYLQAQWTAENYSITYRDQGNGTFSGTHALGYPTSHTYGTATTLKTASKTGYTFGGWYTSSNCTGTAVTSLGATAYTSNITLYAKWSANSYSITYYDEGGSDFSGTHASGYPTSHSYGTATTLLSPTKDGYSFGGWYTTSACTGDAVTSLGATAYTDNIILYAKWQEATGYTVTITFINGQDIYYQFATSLDTSYDSLESNNGWTFLCDYNNKSGSFDTSTLGVGYTIYIKYRVMKASARGEFTSGNATLTQVRSGIYYGDGFYIFSLTNLTEDVSIVFSGSGQWSG